MTPARTKRRALEPRPLTSTATASSQSSTPTYRIPDDLLSSILSYIDDVEGKPTLYACMRASRTLYNLAAPLLYREITCRTETMRPFVRYKGLAAMSKYSTYTSSSGQKKAKALIPKEKLLQMVEKVTLIVHPVGRVDKLVEVPKPLQNKTLRLNYPLRPSARFESRYRLPDEWYKALSPTETLIVELPPDTVYKTVVQAIDRLAMAPHLVLCVPYRPYLTRRLFDLILNQVAPPGRSRITCIGIWYGTRFTFAIDPEGIFKTGEDGMRSTDTLEVLFVGVVGRYVDRPVYAKELKSAAFAPSGRGQVMLQTLSTEAWIRHGGWKGILEPREVRLWSKMV